MALSLAQRLDLLVLSTFNSQIPATFEASYEGVPSLEQVLQETKVHNPFVPEMWPLREGEYRFYLGTRFGRMRLRLWIIPAARPDAPLLLYHHGICIVPYYTMGRPLLNPPSAFDAHIALIQAPFHRWTFDPLRNGLSTAHHAYQMLAGSVAMLAMVHDYYKQMGAPYTVVTGESLGGIVSFLFQGLYNEPARALIPFISSPDLARVFWDAANLVDRPLSVDKDILDARFNFTPYYERCDPSRIYPMLATEDMFFLPEHHIPIFRKSPLVTRKASHVSFVRNLGDMRSHILYVLNEVRRSWSSRSAGNRAAGSQALRLG